MLSCSLPCLPVAVLVLLDIVTVNPFLSLFFEWSHEAIVYNRSDKSFILYSQIMVSSSKVATCVVDIVFGKVRCVVWLMPLALAFQLLQVSCIVMALFLDFGDGPLLDDVDDATVQRNVTVNGTAAYGNSSVETSETNEGSNELANTLAEVFIQAIIAQILLFPVKYLLPYMISNVNSISSAAGDATKSVVAHIQNMMSRPHASRATSKNDHATGEANLTASGASPSSPMRRGFRSMDELREVTEEKQRDIIDYWQNIVKEGAYMRASSEYGPDGTSNAKLHVTTERSSTECMAAAISADEARVCLGTTNFGRSWMLFLSMLIHSVGARFVCNTGRFENPAVSRLPNRRAKTVSNTPGTGRGRSAWHFCGSKPAFKSRNEKSTAYSSCG